LHELARYYKGRKSVSDHLGIVLKNPDITRAVSKFSSPFNKKLLKTPPPPTNRQITKIAIKIAETLA
jgi:hypothetical protein